MKQLNQEQINELAQEFGLCVSEVDQKDSQYSFYLDRDVPNSSLYNMARVVVNDNPLQIEVDCCLLNGKGKISSDQHQAYSDLRLALKDVNKRFASLHLQFIGVPERQAITVRGKNTNRPKVIMASKKTYH